MSLAALDPRRTVSMSHLRRTVQLRERVVEACRLVESRRMVRGVHIVSNVQPTSDELRSYQDYANSSHVNLTVDAHGMISIRPGAAEEA